jgi:uncharacterized membrane-anchored protein YitT (DUF2179 family)
MMKQALKNLPIVLLGNLLMQLGIVLFILPSGLVTGGTTGIALALHHFFGLPISIFVKLSSWVRRTCFAGKTRSKA